MWNRIKGSFVALTLGAAVTLMAGLGVLKGFATETFPWLSSVAGGWFFVVSAILATAAAVYFWVRAERYRAAAKKLMWRYIIDVQDEQAGKPGRGAGQSEGVKRGEESADRVWGDKMYREVLRLPPEDEYR